MPKLSLAALALLGGCYTQGAYEADLAEAACAYFEACDATHSCVANEEPEADEDCDFDAASAKACLAFYEGKPTCDPDSKLPTDVPPLACALVCGDVTDNTVDIDTTT